MLSLAIVAHAATWSLQKQTSAARRLPSSTASKGGNGAEPAVGTARRKGSPARVSGNAGRPEAAKRSRTEAVPGANGAGGSPGSTSDPAAESPKSSSRGAIADGAQEALDDAGAKSTKIHSYFTAGTASRPSGAARSTAAAAPAGSPAPIPIPGSTTVKSPPAVRGGRSPGGAIVETRTGTPGRHAASSTAADSARSRALEAELEAARAEAAVLRDQTRVLEATKAQAEREVDSLRRRLQVKEESYEAERKRGAASLERLMRDVIRDDADARARRLLEQQFRLGRIVTQRTGLSASIEVWEDGRDIKELQTKQLSLLQQREALEKRRKDVQKDLRKATAAAQSAAAAASPAASALAAATGTASGSAGAGASGESTSDDPIMVHLALLEEDEAIRIALAKIKKDEGALAAERKKLDSEKALLLRELKRVRDEEHSRFSPRPVLNNRYQLIKLLGRGGFSEVWHALDLLAVREVAVKVHQLSSHWSQEKKANYIRHATREYSIHKSLRHDRVVRLFEVFEIDINSFATVLEYCRGPDLDWVLKSRTTLPEREARVILMQVLAALHYLHSGAATIGEETDDDGSSCSASAASMGSGVSGAPSAARGKPLRVIHYDLKPGNILFDEEGNAKVTDFGLSKVMPDEGSGGGLAATSMELTSQGAGTYWYLPPETFAGLTGDRGMGAPRISSKVDVWSMGVIYYEMLYGRRPFGHGQSQDKVLADNVILRAGEVTFPAKPSVTAAAKAFIRRCLTRSQAERPTVRELCEDPYMRLKLPGK